MFIYGEQKGKMEEKNRDSKDALILHYIIVILVVCQDGITKILKFKYP